jgi:hypothetical protein
MMNDGGKGSAQRPTNMDAFASNFDKIFRSNKMDEQTRELDLQLGDALAELALYKSAVKEATVICDDVDSGRYGDALMHTHKFYAKVEAIRQYRAKHIDMDGRC